MYANITEREKDAAARIIQVVWRHHKWKKNVLKSEIVKIEIIKNFKILRIFEK